MIAALPRLQPAAVFTLLMVAITPANADCTLSPGPVHTVTRVIDAETLFLDDGGTVRLVGALAPNSPDPAILDNGWAPARNAMQALERWTLGRSVELRFDGRRVDRYGRILAHVYLLKDGERLWLQGRLVEDGLARAYSLSDSRRCAAVLLEREEEARNAGKGVWSLSAYQVLRATRARDLVRYRHTYQIVEGRVRAVTEPGGRTLIVFAQGARTDFFALIDKTNRRVFEQAGVDIEGLARRRIRVRGWIETWSGPFIRLTHPEQIEILSDPIQESHVRRRPFTRAAAFRAGGG